MDQTVVLVLAVLAVFGIAALLFVSGIAATAGWWFARRRRPDPEARDRALTGLGYRRVDAPGPARKWVRTIDAVQLTFEDRPSSWRWVVRLPRYNTLTLQIEEQRTVGSDAIKGRFEAGDSALDGRFWFGSVLPAQTIGLMNDHRVVASLLAVPHLSLRLGQDELVLEDVGLRALQALAGGAAVAMPSSIPVELQVHRAITEVVSSILGAMYSRNTGTIMPEFR